MADVHADWSTNSSHAINISLVQPTSGDSKAIGTFHPAFTYSVFNDEESIFGYQGLQIHLKYHACDMRPNLQIHYNKKFKPVGDVEPTDINEVLKDYLPSNAFDKAKTFETSISDPVYRNWTPPGELLTTYESQGTTCEIWKGSLADKPVQQLVKRLQILVSFFVEGGLPINLEDPDWSLDRWTVYFLYKKNPVIKDSKASPYLFMGYCTVYRYFLLQSQTPPTSPIAKAISRPATLNFELPFPETSSTTLPCRSRISQFIILPPFQGGGNGARFYNTIFKVYLEAPQTVEITVEDPNEAFDDLRDLNDLVYLRSLPDFTKLKINTDVVVRSKGTVPAGKIVDRDSLDTLKRKTKIAPRQFGRLVEMHLLSLIPTSIRKSLLYEPKKGTPSEIKAREHEYHLWQLFVKQRLYRHNKDTLIQLDRSERIDKLQDALDSVEADYARLLRKLAEMPEKKEDNGLNASRKRVAEEDDDLALPSTKKARVSDAEEE